MPATAQTIEKVQIAAEAANRVKAYDIVAFDVSEPLAITEVFLVATASNARQVLAVAEEVEKDLYLKAGQMQPRSREGVREGEWVLLDYGDFIVHVMGEEQRDFYGLERLWADCPRVELHLEHADFSDAGDAAADAEAAERAKADKAAATIAALYAEATASPADEDEAEAGADVEDGEPAGVDESFEETGER